MRKRIQIEYFGIFLFLVVLCALFPWCSDDWTWGSVKGIEQFNTGFKDYNGRYLGNLLVLALTRSRLLRAVFMAVTHTCLLFVLSGLTGEFKGRLAMISAVLFLMPAGMFAQAIAWTSGFTNYVPSIVISLVYIYLVRDIFDSREPQYRRGSALIFLALGAAGSLFIEHVTIYNICLGIFVLVYTWIRFKRVYKPHIAFLVGAVVGAAVMFTNGAYRAVSQGTDWYRSIGHGITGMLVRAWWNAVETVIPYGFRGSCGLMIALCIAACMASSAFHEEINKKWAAWHETAKTIIIFYTAIVIIENAFHYKQVIPLRMGDNVIGRYQKGNPANCTFETVDPSVDLNHCTITVSRDKQGILKYTLKDNNSNTGTFVDNVELSPKERRLITDGTLFTLGATSIILRATKG